MEIGENPPSNDGEKNQNIKNENSLHKTANEVLENIKNTNVGLEKHFFETETEFSLENIKNFRVMLLNANERQTKEIIDSRITFLEESCDKVRTISPEILEQHVHRGYIGGNTKVVFEIGAVSPANHYKLKSTNYIHEAAALLQENKNSVNNGMQLFNNIEGFLISYFGIPKDLSGKTRGDFLEQKIGLNNLFDDELFFQALENIDISIFKGEHVAMCSEQAAIAQNILSLFGYETYYMFGGVSIDGNFEHHAFNVVVDNSGRKNIIDFSITSMMEYKGANWIKPTISSIPDFNSFLEGDKVRTSTYKGHLDDDGKITRERVHNLEYNVYSK